MKISADRLQAWLAGLWAGMVLTVGFVVAPSLFAVLPSLVAGQGAGQIFSVEAKISLALSIVLFLFERRRVRIAHENGENSHAMSFELLLVLGVLFLTVFGEFAIHPVIEAAKAGQPTRLSFGALHGISSALYATKTVMLLTLSWRLTARADHQ